MYDKDVKQGKLGGKCRLLDSPPPFSNKTLVLCSSIMTPLLERGQNAERGGREGERERGSSANKKLAVDVAGKLPMTL